MSRLVLLAVFAVLTVGSLNLHASTPGGGAPADDPTIEFTEAPTANNLHQVTAKIEWTNSTGIAKVKVELFKKGTGNDFDVLIGTKEINTMQVNGNAISKLFPDPAQAANTKIKVKITSLDGTGQVIKSKTSGEVTLP